MVTNALKNKQKSDKTLYDKDIAQSIKLDLGNCHHYDEYNHNHFKFIITVIIIILYLK